MKDKSIDGPGTPLPWRVDKLRLSPEEWAEARDEVGNTIFCHTDGMVSDVLACVIGRNRGEREQRARYIVWSANNAPALVEALQEAREALEPFAVGDPHSHLINAERAYKRIHAVLSTALGEMNDG